MPLELHGFQSKDTMAMGACALESCLCSPPSCQVFISLTDPSAETPDNFPCWMFSPILTLHAYG